MDQDLFDGAKEILHSIFPAGIDSTFPGFKMVERLLIAAHSGYHTLNPYHNVEHELMHLHCSHAVAVNSAFESEEGMNRVNDLQNLAVASLFHDHNHSGGARPDSENIEEALKVVNSLWHEHHYFDLDEVIDLIKVTEYTGGKFPLEPEDFYQRCMRDADLMSIYTAPGRELLLGLVLEVEKKDFLDMKESEVQEVLEKNAEFLRGAEMFTHYGKQVKQLHLEKCLKRFATVVSKYRSGVSANR